MTTPKRTDSNQVAILNALRAVGATVADTHTVGDHFPDLVIGYRGSNYLLEVKTANGHLTHGQLLWHTLWRGNVFVVRTPEEALAAIGAVEYRTLPPQEDPTK